MLLTQITVMTMPLASTLMALSVVLVIVAIQVTGLPARVYLLKKKHIDKLTATTGIKSIIF